MPVAPVAAIPVYADPRGPVRYSTPRVGRPGIITAIGVISIVVGSLGMLGSLGQSFYVVIFYTFTRAMASATATFTPVPPAPPAVPAPATAQTTSTTGPSTASAVEVKPKGFSAAQREAVVAGLKRVRTLSDKQVKNLEALLDAYGQDVILLRGAKLTATNVMKNVSDAGTLPSATGDEGPTYFELGQGRIEVSDAQAAFFPTQGEAVRASADDGSANAGVIHPSGLSDAEVKAVLARVQQLSTLPLNATQVASLTTELQTGTMRLFTPSSSPTQTSSQVIAVRTIGSGAVEVRTTAGSIQVTTSGQVMSTSAWPTSGPPTFNVRGGVVLALVLEGILSFLLAIYLLVIGILTLRQSPRGGRLHMIYAVVKIPLAIASGVGLYFLMSDLFSALPGGSGMNPVALATSTSMGVLFACIYPIALLITLRTRSVREYYAIGMRE